MGFSKLTFKKNYKTKIKKLNTIVNNKIYFFSIAQKVQKWNGLQFVPSSQIFIGGGQRQLGIFQQ
jgi:hypothetical protein